MTAVKQGFNNVNVSLSFQVIRDFFSGLPVDAIRGDASLGKKKERAEAGLGYLEYLFDSKTGDLKILPPCGPRPRIPDIA